MNQDESITYLATLFQTSFGGDPLLFELMKSSLEGHLFLEVEKQPHFPKEAPIHLEKNRLYLQKDWHLESSIKETLKKLQARPLSSLASSISPPETLNQEQKKGFQMALSETLSLLTGGPGTGKTFLISAIAKSDPEATILLAAPTGKAAAKLKEALPNFPITTLHALLRINPRMNSLKKGVPIDADLLIVDESSMIDAELFLHLFSAISSKTRLLLVGDPNQLSPVGKGTLFADLTHLLPKVELTQSIRFENEHLKEIIEDVKKKNIEHLPIQETFSLDQEIETLFSSEEKLSSSRILSAVKEGPLGVLAINERASELFRKKSHKLHIPILITASRPEIDLYNGDTALLYEEFGKPLYAILPNQKKIPYGALPSYELGYALSVHKSQGSEFDTVLFVAGPGTSHFGWEIVYTAITRAKKELRILGSREELSKAFQKESKKRAAIF